MTNNTTHILIYEESWNEEYLANVELFGMNTSKSYISDLWILAEMSEEVSEQNLPFEMVLSRRGLRMTYSTLPVKCPVHRSPRKDPSFYLDHRYAALQL
jgi:hypothetical protein